MFVKEGQDHNAKYYDVEIKRYFDANGCCELLFTFDPSIILYKETYFAEKEDYWI